ncbi:MAG: error-prone DNA polymerase, partial [Acidobacteriota bacterium]|nr:error-prone DNA polymerase [Acidobacteriota bacterium]
PAGTQLALDLDLGDRPGLRPLPSWEAMVADYGTMGLSLEHHPLALLRAALGARGALTPTALAERAHGSEVLVGGLVIARQRPATAKGVTFLLLEDEWGTVNVIVPPALYERRRLAIRAEPLLLARGRLERHPEAGGAINLLAGELCELRESTEETAEPARLEVRGSRSEDGATGPAGQGEELRATGTEGFAPVAPPVTSFARGRRR